MASIRTEEKQGGPQEEKELADMTLKKLVISVPDNEMMMMEVDAEEECKTPTTAGSMIPSIPECPPAPRKKRLPPLPPPPPSSSGNAEKCFFDKVWPEEIEHFFQLMNETARANNGSKSV